MDQEPKYKVGQESMDISHDSLIQTTTVSTEEDRVPLHGSGLRLIDTAEQHPITPIDQWEQRSHFSDDSEEDEGEGNGNTNATADGVGPLAQTEPPAIPARAEARRIPDPTTERAAVIARILHDSLHFDRSPEYFARLILGLNPGHIPISRRQLKEAFDHFRTMTRPNDAADWHGRMAFQAVHRAFDELRYIATPSTHNADSSAEEDEDGDPSSDSLQITAETAEIIARTRHGNPPRFFSVDYDGDIHIRNRSQRRWKLDDQGRVIKGRDWSRHQGKIEVFSGVVEGSAEEESRKKRSRKALREWWFTRGRSSSRSESPSSLRRTRSADDLSKNTRRPRLTRRSSLSAQHRSGVDAVLAGLALLGEQSDADAEEAEGSDEEEYGEAEVADEAETAERGVGAPNGNVDEVDEYAKLFNSYYGNDNDGSVSDGLPISDPENASASPEVVPRTRAQSAPAAMGLALSTEGHTAEQPPSAISAPAGSSWADDDDDENQDWASIPIDWNGAGSSVSPSASAPSTPLLPQSQGDDDVCRSLPTVRPASPASPATNGTMPEDSARLAELPQSDNGLRRGDSSLTINVNGIVAAKPSPAAPGTLVGKDESLASPTPTSASSLDSTTGMSQSQGIVFSEAFDEAAKYSLSKKRSQLIDEAEESGKDMSHRAPSVLQRENKEDKIELLQAKIHKLKAKYRTTDVDALQWDLNRLRRSYANASDELARLQFVEDGYRDLKFRYDEYVEKAEQDLDKQMKANQEILEVRNKDAADYNILLEEYVELQNRLGARNQGIDAGTQTVESNVQQTSTRDQGTDAESPMDDTSDNSAIPMQHSRVDQRLDRPWPIAVHDVVPTHVAEWINAAHAREGGRDIDPLTPEQVRDIMNANANFQHLLGSLNNFGYLFRPDRFAQSLVPILRESGARDLRAMSAERGIPPETHTVIDLLEEIEELRSEAAHQARVQRQRDEAREMNDAKAIVQREERGRLEDELRSSEEVIRLLTNDGIDISSLKAVAQEIEALKEKLELCQEHGEQLTAIKAHLEEDQADLKKQLQACHEHGEQLEAANEELEQANADSEDNYKELLAQLNEADKTIANLGAEVAILKRASSDDRGHGRYEESADQTADLKERMEELEQELADTQSTHYQMMMAARNHIERLKAQVLTPAAQPVATLADCESTFGQAAPRPRPAESSDQTWWAEPKPATPRPSESYRENLTRQARRTQAYKDELDRLQKLRQEQEKEEAEVQEYRDRAVYNLCGWKKNATPVSTSDRLASWKRLAALTEPK